MLARVEDYCKEHPTFYLEELKEFLEDTFPDLSNVSMPTICRALNFDLQLTRKVLIKAAQEVAPTEICNYEEKLCTIYHYLEQLIFIDKMSKDGCDAYRRYARSKKGTKAIVKLPFSCGKRVSVFAALNFNGFMAWESTCGTFTCKKSMKHLHVMSFQN